MNKWQFSTRAIHAGQSPDPSTGAIITPIYANYTYAQRRSEEHKGFTYGRAHNPTRMVYEACLANLEGGKAAFAFASGVAAISTVLELLDHHDHIIGIKDLYGGMMRLLEVKKRSAGLNLSLVDFNKPGEFAAAIQPKTKMVWLESPSNPLLKLVDLTEIAKQAHQQGLFVVVDNTLATPYLQRPLELGCDIVVHSTSKYLSGHANMVGGAVIVKEDPGLIQRLAHLQNALGAIQGPFESFLALTGLQTLALRMKQQCNNARQLAEWLVEQPQVAHVYYPGLISHPHRDLAKSQMKDFGGIITMGLRINREQIDRFLENCRLFTLADGLGGVRSLINHPASMAHAMLSKEQLEQLGIAANTVRLSVGIEAIEDLRADLQHAFSCVE